MTEVSRAAERTPVPEPSAGLSRQYSIYRAAMAVCDELAASAVQGAGPAELTEVFARLIGRRVLLLDSEFGLRAESGADGPRTGRRWSRSDPTVERLLGAVRVARRPLRIPAVPGWLLDEACLVAPVAVREDTLGYLVVLDGAGSVEPDDAEFLSVTYAATLFSLTMANERTSAELDLRHQRAVVEALVHGHVLDVPDARRKAESLGLADGQPFRVAIIRLPAAGGRSGADADSDTASVAAERLAGRVRAAAAGAAVTVQESTVVAIVPEPAGDSGVDPAGWAAALAEVPGDAPTAGLSERVERAEAAPRGYRQAELAIDLGIRLGRAGQTVRYDDLGIYRLLFDIGDMRALLRFAHEVIGPLLTHDRRHTVDLVRTLSVYLAQHGSLKQTARILGLHANTVAYRAQRIQTLTGLDLGDADDRLLAHVAVKIIEAQLTPADQRAAEPAALRGLPPGGSAAIAGR